MKAIIPVAGTGKRLRPHTYTQPKPLIPVAGKPILAYIIDQLVASGIDDFVFIIGYLGENIRFYVEQAYPDIRKTFVSQVDRLGSAHAVHIAAPYIEDEKEIVICFGDTIIDMDIPALLKQKGSCLALSEVSEPREFGIAEIDSSGKVARMIEKPLIPRSNQALVGLYKIAEVKALLDAVSWIIRDGQKTHGEYQLTDALNNMVKDGISFSTMSVNNWYDCGRKEMLLATNAILLKKHYLSTPNHDCNLDNVILIPPVYVGHHCEIKEAIIGPNVSIGDQTVILRCMVSDSIIGHKARLEDQTLRDSLLGNDSILIGARHSLNVGDDTVLDFR